MKVDVPSLVREGRIVRTVDPGGFVPGAGFMFPSTADITYTPPGSAFHPTTAGAEDSTL